MMKHFLGLSFLILVTACGGKYTAEESSQPHKTTTSLMILGTIQDAGSPHIACKRECCKVLFDIPDLQRQVVSLGVYDEETQKKYLFEATPDIARQLKALKQFGKKKDAELPDGIFLTHAHIGHYTGLMYLGKEATNADNTPVYAMPKMQQFLVQNGPWSQLVHTNNIALLPLENEQSIPLSKTLSVTPLVVPHRDEYSETVGYRIKGPNKTALFIPDIDKWEKWDKDIIQQIAQVDYAFVDATFYSGKEIGNRDISQIPHPFIIESMEKFKGLTAAEKQKIVFIHFNHTNPILDPSSREAKKVIQNGFRIAQIHDIYEL
ncbi:MBL fold metallo-hydrolase [Spongiimicrobium salis]|uniref:MBL fold metallo-hydrolase n=1 Tax=Spongiimicrobium salis TaxID=1667022 RepID=UPI00374D16F5